LLFSQNLTEVFSLNGLRITGGVGFSIVGGSDRNTDNIAYFLSTVGGSNYDDTDNLAYLLGIRIGIEKVLPKGLIAGISYTERGFDNIGKYSEAHWLREWEEKIMLNYLTANLVQTLKMEGFSLFAGGEVGYLFSAWRKYKNSFSDGIRTMNSPGTEVINDLWKDNKGTMIDYGLIAGVRYEYNPRLTLIGSYYFGIPKLTREAYLKHRSFQINISYAWINSRN